VPNIAAVQNVIPPLVPPNNIFHSENGNG
jgi:hypothetical protein